MEFIRETAGSASMAFLLLWRRRWIAAGLLVCVLSGGVLPFSLSAAAPGRGLWSLRLLYGGGGAFAALSLFAVVAGVAAFAREAAAGTMPGLLVTPARRCALAFGRLFALTAVLAALWAAACALVAAAARAGAVPVPGGAPADCARFAYASVPFARAAAERPAGTERLAADVLAAGETGRWVPLAPVPPRRGAAADAVLRLSATGALESGGELPLRATLGGAEDAFVLHSGAESERTFPAEAAASGELLLANEGASPVWFSRAGGVALRIPAGGARANFLRGAGIAAAHLVLLAALGMALGALFHPPEALFFALALLLTLAVSPLANGVQAPTREEFVASVSRFGGTTGAEPTAAARRAAEAVWGAYRATRAVLAPLADAGKLARIADGEAVGARELAEAVAVKALLLPFLLALAAAAGLAKREAFAR